MYDYKAIGLFIEGQVCNSVVVNELAKATSVSTFCINFDYLWHVFHLTVTTVQSKEGFSRLP